LTLLLFFDVSQAKRTKKVGIVGKYGNVPDSSLIESLRMLMLSKIRIGSANLLSLVAHFNGVY
jgi:hypothetical protein